MNEYPYMQHINSISKILATIIILYYRIQSNKSYKLDQLIFLNQCKSDNKITIQSKWMYE